MKSMTGYGRGIASDQSCDITVEIKAVNHRHLDSYLRLPWDMSAYDHQLRKLLKKYVKRGKLEVNVTRVDRDEDKHVAVDKAKVKRYYQAAQQIAEIVGMEVPNPVITLVDKPGIVLAEVEEHDYWPVLAKATEMACLELDQLRRREGQAIVDDLIVKITTMQELTAEIAALAPMVPEQYRERLLERLPQLLDQEVSDVYPEQRLLAEISLYAEKCCIDEEVVRLTDHLHKLQEILSGDESRGKVLDFFAQELVREVNTIGSKANNLKITSYVLQLKELIEQYREQIQNLE